jgi:SAM-dependent methyltransferase
LDLWIHVLESGWKIYSTDEKQCRVKKLDGKTWLYDFEDWCDYDFGEPTLRVEWLKGKVKVTVVKCKGAWHKDVFMGDRKIFENVDERSVGFSTVVEPAFVGERKLSFKPPIDLKRMYKKPRRRRGAPVPLTSVSFVTEGKGGVATYTAFLMDALKPKIAVSSYLNLESVKSPSLIHCQHEWGVFPDVKMLVGKNLDSPKVITWHTVARNLSGLEDYVDEVDAEFDAHVVHSSLAKAWLMKRVSQPIHIIPHGSLIWQNLQKSEARGRLGVPLDAQVCFAFGFGGEAKGFLEAVHVVKGLQKRYPRLMLVVSGAVHPRSGSHGVEYLKRLSSEGKEGEVIVLGRYLSEEEINLWADACDILVFNYAEKGEVASASGAAHRVIASGKPIVCSEDPRMIEFQDGIHCLKHSIGDLKEFESNLETLLTEHDLAEQLGRNVRAYAEATSWSKVAEKHMVVYESVCGGTELFGPQHYGEEYFVGKRGGLAYFKPNGTVAYWSYYNPDGSWEGAKPIMEAIKRLLRIESMLDVGCGRGVFTFYAKEAGIDAVGIDFSPWAVSNPYPKAKGLIQLGDVRDIRFPDKSFDLVFATDVMEHIYEEDLNKAISEIQRVARKHIFYNIGTVMREGDEYFVLKKGETPPEHWSGTAVSGHVNVREPSFWRKKLSNEKWVLRDDLVEKFRSLVPKDVLANWTTILITERVR